VTFVTGERLGPGSTGAAACRVQCEARASCITAAPHPALIRPASEAHFLIVHIN
jgi:hypothetical protein